jgi:hypothetical protein
LFHGAVSVTEITDADGGMKRNGVFRNMQEKRKDHVLADGTIE